MERNNPVISIIIPTYNRAHTIRRAIDSVLAQTYKDFEIIVVDDGSTDNTLDILRQYHDPRVKIIQLETNKGVSSAINTGFNHINGEWFTLLGSDDEMIPRALETLIKVPSEIDETIDAITCNCIDSVTGEFSGRGINKSGYLDAKTVATKLSGEHWGLTKTSLLGKDRLNEKLPGFEVTLWVKINERAKRYYIHKGLRIRHSEGDDRMGKVYYNSQKKAKIYMILKEESQYLSILKRYNPNKFKKLCLRCIVFLMAVNDKNNAKFYYSMLKQTRTNACYKIIAKMMILIGPWMCRSIIKTINIIKLGKNLINKK